MKISGTFLLTNILLIFSLHLAVASTRLSVEDLLLDPKVMLIKDSRAWNKLLHIEPNLLKLKSSQISDPTFFLKNQSDYKNLDELSATLSAFLEPANKYEKLIDQPLKGAVQNKIVDHSQHPICRYPARLKFLKVELSKHQEYWSQLPTVNCTFQKIFLEAIDPISISFVFSSYYSDSPGSAFGHTFFRINRKSNQLKTRQELLDYGVGYAANVTVSNGALYALLGLVGGFTGSWTNLPYYYKVREYNNFEARDLWSYDLNLTADEVEMLSLHLWEVGSHYYTYYFFTQNCAFHMLTVLEAAAPRLNLIEHVPFYYVIPSDSMKALFFEKNLVGGISYRPSIRKVFLKRLSLLSQDSASEFKVFAKENRISEKYLELGEEQKAFFLDAAIDLIDLRHPNIYSESASDFFKQKENLLNQRAQLNIISPELHFPIDQNDQPSNSHGSSRLSIGYNALHGTKSGSLDYRFALHDLLDPQIGLPKNSQLEFFNFKFLILPEELKFKEMSLFKVFNLNPVNFFENKPSWGAEIGVQNKINYCDTLDRDCFLDGALLKYGRSFQNSSEQLTVWGLGTINLSYGATLLTEKYYIAPGFELGALVRVNDLNSLTITFNREYPIARNYDQNFNFEFRHSITKDLSIGGRFKDDQYSLLAYFYY